MRWLKILLCHVFLKRVLSRTCEDPIPRTAPEGDRVNCFSVAIDRNGRPNFLVSSLRGTQLHGRTWDGEKYSEDHECSVRDIDPDDLFVRHYYGLATLKFEGIVSLALGRTFFLPYLRLHLRLALDRSEQYRFNQTRLVTKRRMELLRFLLESQFDANDEFVPINSINLMSDLYSERWILHPDGTSQQRMVEFYLKSLVETGDLRNAGALTYELTTQALQTAEEYQEQLRRHRESVSTQRRMVWLTVAIVVLALVQAEIIKLPVVLDLSASSPLVEQPAD